MKLGANEEYGLRCLVRLGYAGEGGSLSVAAFNAVAAGPIRPRRGRAGDAHR